MSDTATVDTKVADTSDKDQPKAGDGQKPGKLSFTPEQQEVVDTLIDRMFGKGFEKAKAELEPKISEAQSEVQKLQKQLDDFIKKSSTDDDKDKAKDKGDGKKKSLESEEAKQLIAQMEELRDAQKALQLERDEAKKAHKELEERQRNGKVRDEFLESAREIGFIDPSEVFMLVKDSLKLDEDSGDIVVMNPKTGRPRMDSTLEKPLTLSEYLSQFAKERKHLVRHSDTGGGTGAGGSKKLDTSDKKEETDFSKMTSEEFDAFKRKVKLSAQTR